MIGETGEAGTVSLCHEMQLAQHGMRPKGVRSMGRALDLFEPAVSLEGRRRQCQRVWVMRTVAISKPPVGTLRVTALDSFVVVPIVA